MAKSKAQVNLPANPVTARIRGHKLLTQELFRRLPEMGDTEAIPDMEKPIGLKLFHPATGWRWYACEVEYDPETEDVTCFGFVRGHVGEWGCFSLRELDEIGAGDGLLPVERDLYPSKDNMTLADYAREDRWE